MLLLPLPPSSECMLYELFSRFGGVAADAAAVAVVIVGVANALAWGGARFIGIDLLTTALVVVLLPPLARLLLPPTPLLLLPPPLPPPPLPLFTQPLLSSSDTFSNSRSIRLRGDTC